MPRMLTEEEVEMIEKQRGLQERKAAAIAGMTDNERLRFREAEEREMWDRRYRETHGGLSRAEVAAAGPNGSGRQYRAIAQGFAEQRRAAELQQARDFELKKQGEEMGTRRFEAEQKRLGMKEQGRDAAEFNKDATIRAAELQTASAKEIAGINAQSNEKIAGINTASAERISAGKDKTTLDVANKQGESTVETAKIQAEAQEKRQMAENLMRQRQLDEKSAIAITKAVTEMVKNSKDKRTGKPRMTEEEALKKVLKQRNATRQSVGTLRPLKDFDV